MMREPSPLTMLLTLVIGHLMVVPLVLAAPAMWILHFLNYDHFSFWNGFAVVEAVVVGHHIIVLAGTTKDTR